MCFEFRTWHMLVILANLLLVHSEEFEQQPKLQAHDGNLILEAAHDQNLTLRMVGETASLLVNDINILEVIKKRYAPNNKVDEENEEEAVSADAVVMQIKSLKQDLRRMTLRLSSAENRTRSTLLTRRIRRFLGRVRRVSERLSLLETRLTVDECVDKPCKNGGSCYDLYQDFYCECPEGWTGKKCDEDVVECYIWAGSDLGCQNNAVCINSPGSYSCNCTNGYSGTHCRLKNAICDSPQSSELCGHGVCVHANNALGYACICHQGWSKDNITTACTVDVDECVESRNPCHSECINLPGSFKCGPCPHGYTGNGMSCQDIDECLQSNGGCSLMPRVQCINTEGSFHCGNCPPGWLGDGHNCAKAQSNSCDGDGICHPKAKCEYISDSVVCTCPLGWNGHGFGANGCSTSTTPGNPCENHECKNNATCVAIGRSTRCICPLGYSGPLCETNDACNPNPCRNAGTCNLLPRNKYRCSCQRGTTGTNCEILRNTCGSIINQESGELTYPPEGGNYEPNERCAWIIRTANTKILNVTFSKFDLEDYPECGKDWLQIHDGRSLAAQLIGRFCGKSLPMGGNIISSHQQIFLWFRSDNATNGSGLKMSWTSQLPICGGLFSLKDNDQGVISSPGYPGKSPANRECEWRLMAPYATRFVFRIYEVTLGGLNDNCTGDALKIFDSNQLLESICRTKLPEPKHTSSNIALVHFHTDSYRADSAFQLHYEVVSGSPNCGGFFTEPTGILDGYSATGPCLFLIQQPLGTKIKLEFMEFERFTASTTYKCMLLTLEIFDGKDDEAPLIKKYCHGDEVETIISSGNILFLRSKKLLSFPSLFELNTLKLKYSRVCENSFFGPTDGIFETPNYPKPYFDHITCTYNIYGPINTIVHANFTDFSISETIPDMSEYEATDIAVNTTKDVDDFANYVDVYLSNDVKRRYYKGEPMQLVSARNRMRIVFHSAVNQRKARGFRVEYSFETVACGGVLTDPKGSFSKYGLSNSLATYCEWILEAPEGKQIKLDLRYSRSGAKCVAGEADVLIYLNSTISGDQLAGSYCDEERSISTTFNNNLVTVILKKVPIEQMGQINYGLTANYTFVDDQNVCGGNFSYRFGVIKSPGWPKPYPAQQNCTWTLTAPLGHKIELLVQNFTVETTSMTECPDDYLELRNGQSKSSPLIGRYCGTQIPSRIPSFTNHLYLHFHSDRYITNPGFYLTWEQTATGCGGTLNSYKGSIHSPHYPEISAGAVVCDWQVYVAQGSLITMKIMSPKSIEDFSRNKILTVYDGPNLNSRVLPFTFDAVENIIRLKSSAHQVFIRYVLQDGARDGQQFLLDYETDCVNQIVLLRGVIETPNFPDNYPPSLHCAWDIHSGRNNKIALTFSHLAVEESQSDCKYDYVEVIDMRDEEVLKTQHLCAVPTDVLQSVGNRLMIKFVSDYSGSAQGFRAEFKRLGCGEHLQMEYGTIESPNAPYSVDVDCDWYIEVRAGLQIVLSIAELRIESDTSNCTDNNLKISNEKNSLPLLDECQLSQSITVTSGANHMYIHFHTNAKRARKYFKAAYTTRSATCGGIFLSKSGQISSPNFPEAYVPNTVCAWSISVQYAYNIMLSFGNFDLPNSTDCEDTYLEVNYTTAGNGTGTLRHCGNTLPTPVTTFGNQLDIVFRAGKLPPKSGFKLNYDMICGGHLTEASGFLKSGWGETCFWFIEAAEGAHVSVDILHLECQCELSGNCTDFVAITSDILDDRPNTFCAAHPVNIVSSGNLFYIRTHNVKFRAMFANVQNSCGGVLTSLAGILASPYYPNSYPSNTECIWEIQAKKSNYIELNFEFLNITSSDFCNGDFLEIRNSEGGSMLGLFCSNQLPVETIRSYEQVWIKFRSVEDSTGGGGFKLRWNYAHENALNGTGGAIESPPFYSVRNQAEPFKWRITVERGYLIWLNFKEYHKGLELYDGFDEVSLKVDIQYSPWEFTSSANALLIKSINSEFEMFKLEWKSLSKEAVDANKSISTCHEDILLPFNARVNISSPGYSKGYANDLNCDWVVKVADPSQHAVLNLYEADLEDAYNCIADSLTISSSSNLREWHEQLKICKSKPKSYQPIAVIHGTPNLKLNFNSDNSLSGRGFTSFLTTACGSNMTAPFGTIMYPHLLLTRIFNSTCLWHIEVGIGKQIEFTFNYGPNMLKPKQLCQQYALIYDGLDDSAPLLGPGQICNRPDRNVRTVLSTSNHAFVKYNMSWSLRNDVMNLWNLTYREYNSCGGELRLTPEASSVNISTPHYPNVPHPYTECIMIVLAPAGESIQINFVDRFDLSVRHCSEEYVEFFDGSTQMANSLGRYCTRPGTLRTTGNALYIHYITAVAEPRNGFRLNVSLAECGGTFTQENNEISSKGYPALGAYPPQTTCNYFIKLPSLWRVKLNFSDIHLPFDALAPHTSDHLEIYIRDAILDNGADSENDTLAAVFYGNVTQMPVLELDSNIILIRFKSFNFNTLYRGFKLIYDRTFGICSSDVTGESGILTISKMVRSAMVMMSCRWKITVPKGQRVRLEFLNLPQQLTAVETTTQHSMMWPIRRHSLAGNSPMFSIYNNHFMQSVITQFDISTFNASEIIESSDNLMLVRLLFTQSMLPQLRNIRARYSSDADSLCPDNINIDSNAGSISLSRLANSTKNFYCQVQFNLNPEETISFTIAELRTALPNTYRLSYAVRFMDEKTFQTIKTLFTNESNFLLAISTERGSIGFMQSGTLKILKFEATYRRHSCGGQLRIEDEFVIAAPNFDILQYGSLDCVWLLDNRFMNKGLKLQGNTSFTDSCEEEYIAIYAGPKPGIALMAKICRDSAPFNGTILQNRFTTVVYHVNDYKPKQSNFRLSVEKTVGCGMTEIINSLSGKTIGIETKTYRNNMECSWELRTHRGLYLTISFPGRIFIEESVNCTKDYLEIEYFDAGIWMTDERLCGRVTRTYKNFTTNRIRVTFRTDDAITADGFQLLVKPTCDATFNVTSATQTIHSPEFMGMSRPNFSCVYKLYTDSNQRINVRIVDLAGILLVNRCNLYSITAYKLVDVSDESDESGKLIESGKYCGGNAELRSRNFLQLNIDALMERNMRIEFDLDACGGSVTKPTSIRTLHGDVSDNYANDMNCIWNVTAPVDHSILLRFIYFEMEPNDECRYDYLAVYAGALIAEENRVTKICGNLTAQAPVVLVDGNQAMITAVSDDSSTFKGFLAELRFTQNCNERIALSDGNSPVTLVRHLKFNASELLYCQYRIMAPAGYRVRVTIKDLQLGCALTSCERCNYIEVFDSVEAKRATLGKHCATGRSAVSLVSSFEDMTFKLSANQPGQLSFEIVLQMEQSLCGGLNELQLNDEPLSFRFPTNDNAFYTPNAHCMWRITSKTTFEIEFDMLQLQNVSQVTGKCLDYVQIKSQYLSQYYCGNATGFKVSIPKFVVATADIIFHSDATVQDKGFKLTAKHRRFCNRTYTETSGLVTYSRSTSENEICFDDIKVPTNYTLTIYEYGFNAFMPEYNCSRNYLKVIDLIANKTIQTICRFIYSTNNVLTTTNEIRIEYAAKKLELFYLSTKKPAPPGCGGEIYTSEGVFENPPYGQDRNQSECRWDINVPAPNRIRITFYSFDMGATVNCALDYLSIIEVKTDNSEKIEETYCGQALPSTYISQGNHIAILSKKSPNFNGIGWRIRFETYDNPADWNAGKFIEGLS